jgi:hypothetical protein
MLTALLMLVRSMKLICRGHRAVALENLALRQQVACRDREFLYGRRWACRTLALEEAEDQKAAYLRKGGVLIA